MLSTTLSTYPYSTSYPYILHILLPRYVLHFHLIIADQIYFSNIVFIPILHETLQKIDTITVSYNHSQLQPHSQLSSLPAAALLFYLESCLPTRQICKPNEYHTRQTVVIFHVSGTNLTCPCVVSHHKMMTATSTM